ncbi:hypothetical protein Tco_0860935 [Tanacetum coccineum]|uniref:Xylulose kinase-1 n=1 Tax=Tanacetum coccineum TaxID=301880 RepID=A0ABQ5BK27_9ASTR
MAFVPKHNQVGFLKKPEGSAGFEQIVDFLKGTHIRYALEHNPTIYVSVIKQFWQTVTVITLDNGEQELKATIDTHEYTISESSVRNKLKLADENAYQLTKKIFGNMNRGFAGVYRPLLANMIAGHDTNQGEPQEEPKSKPTLVLPPTQVETSSPELKSISPEPMEHTYDQPQTSHVQQLASPKPQLTSPPKSLPFQGPTSTFVEATRINVRLMHLVPSISYMIDNLEKLERKENKQDHERGTKLLLYENCKRRSKKLGNKGLREEFREKNVFETKESPTGKDSGRATLVPSGLQAADTSIKNFVPMDSEKEKESLKRSGETLQGAEKKKQKVLDVEDIPIPESAKFVKEEEIEARGAEPSATESGEVDLTSSTLTHEMERFLDMETTAYGPEEDLESAFAENLRIMFDPPQSEDTVWSLPMHIPIVNWRYRTAKDHKTYPLSAEMCKAMLDKKLQGGKPDENCYKMLKMMEKQAGAKGLTSPEQTATGKGISNLFMAVMSEWLTGKETSNPFKIFNDSPLTGVNTPGSDENRLKLYDLMYIIVNVADMMDC